MAAANRVASLHLKIDKAAPVTHEGVQFTVRLTFSTFHSQL